MAKREAKVEWRATGEMWSHVGRAAAAARWQGCYGQVWPVCRRCRKWELCRCCREWADAAGNEGGRWEGEGTGVAPFPFPFLSE
eukprot:116814-Chlamydomonas_euryale.AAC.1